MSGADLPDVDLRLPELIEQHKLAGRVVDGKVTDVDGLLLQLRQRAQHRRAHEHHVALL